MLIRRINYTIEFFIYLAAFGLTFSNAVNETAVYLAIFLFIVKKLFFERDSFPSTKINLLLWIFLGIAFLSFLRSDYPKESLRGFLRCLKYIFLFFAVFDIFSGDQQRAKRLTWVLIGISFLIFFDGLFQSITGFDFMRHKLVNKLDYLMRIQASFVHPNDFGGYIATVIPLYFILFYKKGLKKPLKIFLAFFLVLGLFCLLKTSSRSAWLGFIPAVFLFFYYFRKRFTFIGILVVLAAIFLFPHGSSRIKDMFNLKQGSSWERVELWEGTAEMIKQHPFFGFGINTYSKYFPQFKPKEYPDLRYTHNSYLQMWSETGIIGLGAFLLVVFFVLKEAFLTIKKTVSRRKELTFILLSALSGLIAFLVQAGFDTNFYSLATLTLFWLFLAYVYSLSCLIKQNAI